MIVNLVKELLVSMRYVERRSKFYSEESFSHVTCASSIGRIEQIESQKILFTGRQQGVRILED